MKNLLTNLFLWTMIAAAFSGLTGCSAPASNTTSTATDANSTRNTPATNAADKSDYPPLASALADAELENLDGTKTKISDRKGKVVLVNIWGIWCLPCIAEMPHLIAMQEMYREQGFEIIGMNIGADDQGTPEDLDEIKKFAEKKKLNYTIVRSTDAITKQFYKITREGVVPQSLVIDREGRLRGVFIGGGGKVLSQMQDTVGKVVNER
jgi:thiol-disulfide isomerase/thioredoxin